MKEREENRIKELFHELKREDERRAPAFARTMEAALSRGAKTRQPWPVLPVAVVAIILALVAVSVFIIFKRGATKTYQTEPAKEEAQNTPALPPSLPPSGFASEPRRYESPN